MKSDVFSDADSAARRTGASHLLVIPPVARASRGTPVPGTSRHVYDALVAQFGSYSDGVVLIPFRLGHPELDSRLPGPHSRAPCSIARLMYYT